MGPYLALQPELCMIIEDEDNIIVGYACAALDSKKFHTKQQESYISEMCLKYPKLFDEDNEVISSKFVQVNDTFNYI